MTTETMTLTEFLLARITEDEAVAISAARYYDIPSAEPTSARWEYAPGGEVHLFGEPQAYITCDTEGLSPAVESHQGPHIARHDPARVLAECEAKRRNIAWLNAWQADVRDEGLRILTVAYADHPDCNPDWRP